jgi:CheY-like chemotaxis protein
MNDHSIVTVLHIEDDEIDRRAVKRAFRKIGFDNPAYEASDGREGLRLLREEAGTIPEPRMVLLDLKMAVMNGHEFLAELRRDPQLRSTIVFVLTTSDNELDKRLAFESNVAGYLLKSNATDEFIKNMQLICDYVRQSRFPTSAKS